MIRREDYGPVMIFGYYDDDEDGNAIVWEVTAEQRLGAIVRCVYLLRGELERNGDRYDGRMVPNLTSITRPCHVGKQVPHRC